MNGVNTQQDCNDVGLGMPQDAIMDKTILSTDQLTNRQSESNMPQAMTVRELQKQLMASQPTANLSNKSNVNNLSQILTELGEENKLGNLGYQIGRVMTRETAEDTVGNGAIETIKEEDLLENSLKEETTYFKKNNQIVFSQHDQKGEMQTDESQANQQIREQANVRRILSKLV